MTRPSRLRRLLVPGESRAFRAALDATLATLATLAGLGPQALALSLGAGRRHPALVDVATAPRPDADVVAAAEALPWATDSVAAVVCDGLLERLERPERALHEIARVLAPGGVLLLAASHLRPSRSEPGHLASPTPFGLERLVRSAGLEILERGAAAEPSSALSELAVEMVQKALPWRPLARAAAGLAAVAALPFRPLDRRIDRAAGGAGLAAASYVRARKPPLPPLPPGPLRLHVGSGAARLEGWVNLDIQALPGVDVVADVTEGLRFSGAEAIYAEHFLEHLPVDAALGFLREAHRALAPGGWLRLSTPNLDWIWITHYRPEALGEEKILRTVRTNRAFYGWQHRFLWSRDLLAEALVACGFAAPRWCRWGESELPVFHGIERHETYPDEPHLPHVLIAETHKAEPRPERLAELRAFLQQELLSHLKG